MKTSPNQRTARSSPRALGTKESWYSTREVARLVDLPDRRLRKLASHGLVARRRGRRGHFRYSFQDLVLLRNLRPLDKNLAKRRMVQQLCDLKEQLGSKRPFHTLRFDSQGRRLVVRGRQSSWEAETGQLLMDFRGRPRPDATVDINVNVVRPTFHQHSENDETPQTTPASAAVTQYDLACRLEDSAPSEARDAYLEVLRLDPEHVDAHLNLGRLLHEEGNIEAAAKHYQAATRLRTDDATAFFNLGVAQHDLGQLEEATQAYDRALKLDANYADAHYNLAVLHKQLGDQVTALRHMKSYRWLVEGR